MALDLFTLHGTEGSSADMQRQLLTVDAMFQINLKYFSIYAKYSPMNVMDKKYWPEFTTWTFGIAPF